MAENMTPAEEKIRAALQAGPTPGPWWVDPNHYGDVQADGTEVCSTLEKKNVGAQWDIQGPITVDSDTAAANAKLIAACNPAALAELLAELDGERNRSQMYADLVRGVAVVLRGEGWSDTSKLPEEVASLRAEVEALRAKVSEAYGYLWLVNNEPGTPWRYPPEKAAYEARKCLRDLLTKEQRGEAINAALQAVRGAAIDAAKGGE